MTPKEKAIKLVKKFEKVTDDIDVGNYRDINKRCAMIMVDEMLDELDRYCYTFSVKWWREVKEEIEKL